MAVQTANTVQTGAEFLSPNWIDENTIHTQLDLLLSHYKFDFVKIGLAPHFTLVNSLITSCIKANKNTKVIWDPVLSATAGYDFNQAINNLDEVLKKLHLITPNYEEIQKLSQLKNPIDGAVKLSKYCMVLLKGGHRLENKGQDILFMDGKQIIFNPKPIKFTQKHGTGCVLSSAITANLAKGYPIKKSILRSKRYIERFIESNTSLIGTHKP